MSWSSFHISRWSLLDHVTIFVAYLYLSAQCLEWVNVPQPTPTQASPSVVSWSRYKSANNTRNFFFHVREIQHRLIQTSWPRWAVEANDCSLLLSVRSGEELLGHEFWRRIRCCIYCVLVCLLADTLTGCLVVAKILCAVDAAASRKVVCWAGVLLK